MSGRPDTDDYRALLLAGVPMMDMRAPTEFAQGAFPTASSLPLMNDEERAQVGTCYKHKGQHAAVELGHELVSGEIRRKRLSAWCDFAQAHPTGYLYCFRGGLRSQTVQAWLREEGVEYPLIRGGYKAMRRFLIDELERSVGTAELMLISGKTGTGKTRVIWELSNSVDLEGLANHRGSTFGQLPQPQPTQIDFENALSINLMRVLDAAPGSPVYLEDEGRLIGRRYLPEVLRAEMENLPMLVVEESMRSRVDVVIEDYVLNLGSRYRAIHGEAGSTLHRERLQEDLSKISKRLGGERCQRVSTLMLTAFEHQDLEGDVSAHGEWIQILLEQYYDPMYEYQLSKRGGKILFAGCRGEVVARAAGRGGCGAQ